MLYLCLLFAMFILVVMFGYAIAKQMCGSRWWTLVALTVLIGGSVFSAWVDTETTPERLSSFIWEMSYNIVVASGLMGGFLLGSCQQTKWRTRVGLVNVGLSFLLVPYVAFY
jgi:hypothetical protein